VNRKKVRENRPRRDDFSLGRDWSNETMNARNPRPTGNIHEFDQLAPALADGELDPAAHLAATRHLARDPLAVRKVLYQQQLRQRVAAVMAQDLPAAAPAHLRQRIADLAADLPLARRDESTEPSARSARGRQRWTALALAAMFFLAALVTIRFIQPAGRSSPGDDTLIAGLIPAAHVSDFAARHVTCSRGIALLRNTVNLPANVRDLPAGVAQYLGRQPYPVLDLSAMGYDFDRAGPCTLPGDRSVHLIYKAKPASGHDDALSLWIEPDAGSSALPLDQPLHLTGARSAHPMIVWRHAGMIYYLVGDSSTAVERALATLAAAGDGGGAGDTGDTGE
jgi:anti-sigma factor RsiW